MNTKARLEKLEAKYQPLEIKPIFCFPMQDKYRSSFYCANYIELAAGIFTSAHRKDDGITYETLAQLEAWIAIEHSTAPDKIFSIITPEKYKELCDKFDAEC